MRTGAQKWSATCRIGNWKFRRSYSSKDKSADPCEPTGNTGSGSPARFLPFLGPWSRRSWERVSPRGRSSARSAERFFRGPAIEAKW